MNAKDMRTTAAGRLGAEESARHQAAEEIADTGIPAGEQIGPAATKKPSKLLLVLAAMGPGVVTAMAGNDAGGISTYSTAGANFGFGTLWVIPIMCVLLAVVETTAGRMGAVTGKGFAALIRERFGIRIAAFAMLALLVGNVATTFSEFAGIASGMEMFGVSKYISVPVAALGVWLLVVGGSYKRVQRVFLGLSLVFLTYVVAAFLAQPNWGEALHDTVVPTFVGDVSFISLVIAMIGTTIAPWMMFFSQSNVVEKGLTPKDLFSQKADAVSGTIAACVVAWFIIVTTGAVLFPAGITIDSAADAAAALAPFAGPYAEALFAVGLIAASFLAAVDHGVRHLRGLRLGGGRLLQVARGPHVQIHLHLRDRVLGHRGAHSRCEPVGHDADGPVRQRRHFAHSAGAHGHHLGGQVHHGRLPKRTRVEGASVGHRRCGGGAHRGAARDAGAGARIAVRSVRSIRPPRLSCRLPCAPPPHLNAHRLLNSTGCLRKRIGALIVWYIPCICVLRLAYC